MCLNLKGNVFLAKNQLLIIIQHWHTKKNNYNKQNNSFIHNIYIKQYNKLSTNLVNDLFFKSTIVYSTN